MISPTDTVYPILKDNMNLKELNSCFLVTEEEIKFIDDETRQESAKLGFLITLKTFQILGYFVSTKTVPKNIISFISFQINIEENENLLNDYDSSRNRFKHMDKILDYLSVKTYSNGGDEVISKTARNTALVRENIADIINVCVETLLHDRIELPAFSRLHREAMSQRAQVYTEIYSNIFDALGDKRKDILESLFIVDEKTRRSLWDNVKFEVGAPKPKEIKNLIKHIGFLNKIIEIDALFDNVPSVKVEQMSIEATALDAADISKVEPKKRYSLAVALIKIRKSKSVDALIDIFLKQMSCIFYLAKEELDKYLKENQEKTDEIMKKFISVEDVVNKEINNDQKMNLISDIYQNNSVLSDYARTHIEYGGKQHFRFMAKFFRKKRKLMFRILESINFFSATQDEGVVRALDFMLAHKRGRKPIIETYS